MDRKAAIREYKETPPAAGLFEIRNTKTGRRLIGFSPNLPGMLNRQRFQLENGSHADKELQADWDALGPDAFEFGVLDELEPSDDPAADLAADLRELHEMWLEKLSLPEEMLYPFSRRQR